MNSIRLSIKIKQADDIERILCHKFTRFMTQRAEGFIILRRKPIPVSDGLSLMEGMGRGMEKRRRREGARRRREGRWSS